MRTSRKPTDQAAATSRTAHTKNIVQADADHRAQQTIDTAIKAINKKRKFTYRIAKILMAG